MQLLRGHEDDVTAVDTKWKEEWRDSILTPSSRLPSTSASYLRPCLPAATWDSPSLPGRQLPRLYDIPGFALLLTQPFLPPFSFSSVWHIEGPLPAGLLALLHPPTAFMTFRSASGPLSHGPLQGPHFLSLLHAPSFCSGRHHQSITLLSPL